MKKFGWLLILFFTSACQTMTPVSSPQTPEAEPTVSETELEASHVQKALGLQRPMEKLGYTEKAFNPCQVGRSPSNEGRCATKHLVVIHFQLMCRDSEGTTSKIHTVSDLQPVSRQPVKWVLKDLSGTVQTDSQGFGQIRVIAPKSQGQQRLKLTVGNQFLYTKAQEITLVATPPAWCNQSSI